MRHRHVSSTPRQGHPLAAAARLALVAVVLTLVVELPRADAKLTGTTVNGSNA